MANGEIILYTTEDGTASVQPRTQDGTVWLTQAEIAELFQTTPQNTTSNLRAIYTDNELVEAATCKERLQVQSEWKRTIQRNLKFYNLSAILAIGYRIRSPQQPGSTIF
ncbi:MAG: virulence RhuM family protein [Rhabdochlamydiaceae bacterium]|jgi:hypothetical protein